MRPARTVVAVGLLLLAAGQAAAQPANGSPPPAAPSDIGPVPPGIQRFEIKPDTPAERAAFLARRRASLEQQKIETVAPLPAQRLPPSQFPAPRQR